MNVAERLAQALMDDGSVDVKFMSVLGAGSVVMGAMQTPPAGFLPMHGNAYSRTLYHDLFKAIGTVFGAGDGKTAFNVPDARGLVVRAHDAGRNVDPNRAFGSLQDDAIRNMTGHFKISGSAGSLDGAAGVFKTIKSNPSEYTLPDGIAHNGGIMSFAASHQVPTAAENRMKNIALSFFIKY